MLDRIDERSAEREERLRKAELEMEMKIQEMEGKREEIMFAMYMSMMQQLVSAQSPPIARPF